MDTFMDKLAQKLTAQEIIRGNLAADAEEMDTLKEQVKDYQECIDQVKAISELMERLALSHPDISFCFISNKKEMLPIYETGVGKIRLRGKIEVELGRRKTDRDKLVITEIPYTMIGAGINKFLMDVADLVETRKLPDVVDISNQSNKEGIRIVLD